MRIASWNIRGFGGENKKSMIRRLVSSENIEIMGMVETKQSDISQGELQKCWGRIAFDYFQIAAIHNSGGLLLTWKQESFKPYNSLATQRWLCVIGELTLSQTQCAIWLVYAPSDHQGRLQLWNQLRSVKSNIDTPCIFMGDFNEVLHPDERRGAISLSQGMREFQNFIMDLQLVDMDIGQRFTWLRKNAASRLDRLLIDKDLLLKFPNSKVFCKERMFSDHFPLIWSTSQQKWGPSPFRSLDCWLDEPSFLRIFKSNWTQLSGFPLHKKLKLIKGPIREWNKNNFGHIESKISSYQIALSTLEKEAQSRVLEDHEWIRMDALRSQLWLWMARKMRYWRQLSRSKIIKEGDRNTKFFHLKASMRRQRNMIDKIQYEGKESSDIGEIRKLIIAYFKDLYKKPRSTKFDISNLNLQRLTEAESLELERPVTKQEITAALSECDPSKAPGYDGFNLKCIKHMWSVIGEDFCTYILNFFETGALHASFNTTWVILIPKKKGAVEVTDFRPISLIGSIYKVIAKILSSRLKSVLPNLIGDSQTAFVSGRQILDGALIANEVVHWLKMKKKQGVLLKLDFQKAFDTIDWDSLIYVLEAMGFGSKWRNWVYKCISSASISILINGVPSKPFKMGRGLRQGDPLSPFLFVIMSEVLNKILQQAIRFQLFKGVSVGNNNVQISHLQFADDTLIFSEANEQYLLRIKEILLCFQAFSGLVINFQKSGLIALGKDEDWSQNMADQLGCSLLKLPMTYLGIPLGASMRKVASWQCIIDKIQKNLASWKSCCLSRAGRLVLIKSVLNCLPIYYLSLFKLPKKVANEIIRIQRRFLWSGSKEGKFMPLVKWDIVQQQRDKGGLGVGDIVVKNAALLFKWWWRYANEEEPFWKRVCLLYTSPSPRD